MNLHASERRATCKMHVKCTQLLAAPEPAGGGAWDAPPDDQA